MNTLRSSSYELIQFFELTPDLVCIVGKDGFLRHMNKAVTAKLGYTREELMSVPVSTFIHPADRDITSSRRKDLLDGIPLTNFQNRYLTRTAKTIWLHWTSVYIPEREIVFAIAKDVTERKLTEREAEENYRKYKTIANHFKQSLENDRKYLAAKLHEEIAQLAASIRLDLDTVINHDEHLSENLKERLAHAMSVTDLLINSIRKISYAISPGMLETLGLTESLRWMLCEMTGTRNVACQFECNADPESLPDVVKLDLYRIAQETLNNLMFRGETTIVKLELTQSDSEYCLLIENDSNAFYDLSTSPDLIAIKSRVASMNGNLQIISEPEKGTKIMVFLNALKLHK